MLFTTSLNASGINLTQPVCASVTNMFLSNSTQMPIGWEKEASLALALQFSCFPLPAIIMTSLPGTFALIWRLPVSA